MSAAACTAGLISDTHGMVRPAALQALHSVELIIHAGDVGSQAVLDELAGVAPVHAVRGNTDGPPLSATLPQTRVVQLGGVSLYVLHDLSDLDLDPSAAGIRVVVHGHIHRPDVSWHGDVVYVNPGSAGPRRLDIPPSVARIVVCGNEVQIEMVEL